MALRPCRECKAQISTSASSCPRCGAKRPTTTPGAVLVGASLLCLGIYILQALTGGEPPSQTVAVSPPAAPPYTSESFKLDPDAFDGHVLPFKIIGAVRNLGFKEGMVDAQISVSVEGGNSADWMATAVYIAEHSLVNGATFSEVEVYVPNPWGDNPPTEWKMLSKVYYAPEPPPRSPWSDKWTIVTANRAPSLAEVEYDKLSGDLLSDRIADPDKRMEIADAKARTIVIRKYKLSPKWKPPEGLGLNGVEYKREHIKVLTTDDINESIFALTNCLNSEDGNGIFKGCLADRANR